MKDRLHEVEFDIMCAPRTLSYVWQTMIEVRGKTRNSAGDEFDPAREGDPLDVKLGWKGDLTPWDIEARLPGYLIPLGLKIAESVLSLMKGRRHGLFFLPEPYLTMVVWALKREQRGISPYLTKPCHGISIELFVNAKHGIDIG